MERSSVFKSKGKEHERVVLTEIELKDRVIRLETYKERLPLTCIESFVKDHGFWVTPRLIFGQNVEIRVYKDIAKPGYGNSTLPDYIPINDEHIENEEWPLADDDTDIIEQDDGGAVGGQVKTEPAEDWDEETKGQRQQMARDAVERNEDRTLDFFKALRKNKNI